MLQLFRNNQLYTIGLVVLYALFFYPAGWLYAPPVPDWQGSGWLSDRFFAALGNNFVLHQVLGGLLLLFQALYINYLVQIYRMGKRPTYLTAVSYIVVFFLFSYQQLLTPPLLALSFVLLSLGSLYRSYEKGAMGSLFNAGFWLSVAALCYFSLVVLFLWLFVSLLLMRSMQWREWLMPVFGFLTPLFWVGVYHFWDGSLSLWLQTYRQERWGWSWQIDTNPFFWLGLGALVLVVLAALANWQGIHYKTGIKEQKCIQVLFWLAALIPLTLLAQGAVRTEHLALYTPPAAALLSLNLQSTNRNGLTELAHLLFFLIAFVVQYLQN